MLCLFIRFFSGKLSSIQQMIHPDCMAGYLSSCPPPAHPALDWQWGWGMGEEEGPCVLDFLFSLLSLAGDQ